MNQPQAQRTQREAGKKADDAEGVTRRGEVDIKPVSLSLMESCLILLILSDNPPSVWTGFTGLNRIHRIGMAQAELLFFKGKSLYMAANTSFSLQQLRGGGLVSAALFLVLQSIAGNLKSLGQSMVIRFLIGGKHQFSATIRGCFPLSRTPPQTRPCR